MEELRACPFCEEDHVSVDGESGNHTGGESHWQVCCNFCGACGPEVKTRAQAVSTWNEIAGLREQVAEMKAILKRVWREMDADVMYRNDILFDDIWDVLCKAKGDG